MRYTSAVTIVALALAAAPAASAQTPDTYADSLYQASNQVYMPADAVGAPDRDYAEFFSRDANLTLDMGAGEEGTGDLDLFYQLVSFGASYRVEFLDASFGKLHEAGGVLPLYMSQVTVAYPSTAPYRYVRVTSIEEEVWKLDAIGSEGYAGTAPPSEEPAPEPEPEPAPPTQGMIVKLPDDGDPATTHDAAVYAIGGDGMRHAFPNETVFSTWYANFDLLAYIDPENLASYPLGGNVTVRPGTSLVKLQTDPKVYAVEPGGILRWITSEQVAASLYGPEWAKRVIDVPDVFFGNYDVGDPVSSPVHPTGTLGSLPTGEVVFIRNAVYYRVPNMADMRFQSRFIVAISAGLAGLYMDGGELAFDPDIAYPY